MYTVWYEKQFSKLNIFKYTISQMSNNIILHTLNMCLTFGSKRRASIRRHHSQMFAVGKSRLTFTLVTVRFPWLFKVL